MELVAVDSSNIAAIGHDKDSNILRVNFVKGGTYDYENVSEEMFHNLVKAESVGKAFHAQIKTKANVHPFKKVA